jgi:hypothetical protein
MKRINQTFKLNFTNALSNSDFLIIDGQSEGHAIDLFLNCGGMPESIISIENVTGKFVDSNGQSK